MPTNKKKKKPVTNPARGFATTSTASKAKPQDTEENTVETGPKSADPDGRNLQEHANATKNESEKHFERCLHELTPEELEKQLEESSLQIFIENHGDKVRKDVSRHVSRLQTERRLLRSQAMPLSTYQWLPEDIMRLIISQLDTQPNTKPPTAEGAPDSSIVSEDISGDDLLVRVWTLRQLLPQLGFSLNGTNLALRHLLTTKINVDIENRLAGRDMIWGLEDCLSWLAFAAKPEDLPGFETSTFQRSERNGRLKEPKFVEETGEKC